MMIFKICFLFLLISDLSFVYIENTSVQICRQKCEVLYNRIIDLICIPRNCQNKCYQNNYNSDFLPFIKGKCINNTCVCTIK